MLVVRSLTPQDSAYGAVVEPVLEAELHDVTPFYEIAGRINQTKRLRLPFADALAKSVRHFPWSATLVPAVLDVVPCRSKKEMVGAYARRIVAFVENIKAAIKGAVRQLVGNTMSTLPPPIELNAPVSKPVSPCRPYPTSRGFVDALPKSIFIGHSVYINHLPPEINGLEHQL